jgi:hypothetical protein
MSAPEGPRAKHRIFLAVVCLLAAAPIVRIGDIQLLEVFFFFHLLWLTLALALRNFRFPVNDLWRSVGILYAIFFTAVIALALASLRFRFYLSQQDASILKLPFILSIARATELFLGVFYMLYIATILRDDPPTRLYAIRLYFWTGFATACFSLLSVPLLITTGLEWGVYIPNMRARGLFNEGGPYGLFLISVMVAGLVLYRAKGLTKGRLFLAGLVILPIFFLAQSKSAVLACFFLFLLNVFVVGSFRLRLSLIVGASVFAVAILTLTSFTRNFMGYVEAYELVQEAGQNLDAGAYGGFGGRLAGAILVPRMIAAHPVTGIGLGNYPILFNDPHYLQGLPYTENWEAPGLGIAGYVAELGIPLFLYLILILCSPSWLAYRRKSSPIILVFAAVQPLVHLFGVQLNFYYPWICSGMALSFLDFKMQPSVMKRRTSKIRLPSLSFRRIGLPRSHPSRAAH